MEPSRKRKHEDVSSDEDNSEGNGKRVIGPSLPSPAAGRDSKSPDNESSDTDTDSDDDIGPMLPPLYGEMPAAVAENESVERTHDESSSLPTEPRDNNDNNEAQRDQWMLELPDAAGSATRIDPTKLRNRKFQSGKSTKDPSLGSKGADASWTESPGEKMRRLQDRVLGIASSSGSAGSNPYGAKWERQKRARNERMKEQAVCPHADGQSASLI